MSENGSTSGRPSSRNRLVDEVYEIAHAVLEGCPSAAERGRLDELVCQNDEARRAYIRFMQESVAIRQALAVQSPLADLSSIGIDDDPVTAQRHRPRTSRTGVWASGLAAIVALAVLLSVDLSWWFQPRGPTPRRIARIQQSTGAIWKKGDGWLDLKPGDWLDGGRYQLTKGLAQLKFPWGTEVTLEAPTEIEFAVDGSRRLLRGQLVAKVSAEDTGFTIETPTVKIVDLGTEFGISAAANGDSEVHVFKGSVEARQRYRDRLDTSAPIKLGAGQATIFRTEKDPVREILYNPWRFSRAWRVANRVHRTTGGMRFVHPPPASVVEGETESNEALLLFLERESAELPAPTAVSFTHPGLYTTFGEQMLWLPAHLEVDSYLIHFDPVGRPGSSAPVTVKGSVTFDRPIFGVIARGDLLGETDAVLAAPNVEYLAATKYGGPRSRGYLSNPLPPFVSRGLTGISNPKQNLRRSSMPNDWIQLSRDRRTLTVSCTGDGTAEQLRVLVAANELDVSATQTAPPISGSLPFYGRPFSVGERIQAEDFDLGGPRVGYQDNTPDLMANTYRTRDSVEIYSYFVADTDELLVDRADHIVCFTRAGEWMAYTVQIPKAGDYLVQASVSSRIGDGRFRIEFGEAAITESITVPLSRTTSVPFHSESFVTVESTPVTLSAGTVVMRVIMERNHQTGWVGDFDWFRVVPVSIVTETPRAAAATRSSHGT